MKLKSDKLFRKVSKKNYYIVLLVSILIIILTLYIRSFYLNYKNNQSNNGIFYDKSIIQVHVSDINFKLNETSEAILYIANSNSSRVRKMERKLFNYIESKKLNDMIIYWDVSKINEKEYLKVLTEKFPNLSNSIGDTPMIIYIKDGNAVEVINSNEKMLDENMLNSLLIKYGIE